MSTRTLTPWVPIHDAADVVTRSIKTLRGWVTHLEVRSISDRETGQTLVHWLDVQRVDQARPKEQPVTAQLAAAYIKQHGGQHVTVEQIRTWAWRGQITSLGAVNGRAYYDLRSIVRLAVRRGLLDAPSSHCDTAPSTAMPEVEVPAPALTGRGHGPTG